MSKRRVVVTGMGIVSPLGNDLASTWDGIVNGRSGIGPITHFDPSPFTTRIVGQQEQQGGSHAERLSENPGQSAAPGRGRQTSTGSTRGPADRVADQGVPV